MLTDRELNKILVNLAEELDISPTKYKQAVDRYTAVGDWLNDGKYEGVYEELDVYPQGSFRLGTVIRPLKNGKKSGYDIDLVCQLPLLRKSTSPEILKNDVGDRLKGNGKYWKMLDKEGRRCWTLLYSEEDGIGFHLDVLPSIPAGEFMQKSLNEAMAQYQYACDAIDITEKDRDSGTYTWKISGSNPRGYAVWFEDRNRAAFVRVESRQKQMITEKYATVYASVEEVPNELIRTPLQRSVQILKRHRDMFFKNDPDNKPISMIITTLSALAYNGETDLVTALYNIVDELTSYDSITELTESTSGLIKKVGGEWVIPNPVNPAENFADRWNEKGSRRPQEFFRWLARLRQDFNYAKQYRDITSMSKFLWPLFGVQLSQAETSKFDIIESRAKQKYPKVEIKNPARPWRP